MAKTFQNTGNKRHLELVVLLSIFLLFVGTALAIVILGANSYKLIGRDMENNFNVRTPMAYIATKVRQNDRLDGIKIKELDSTSVLVLEETVEDITYETWIYAYEGQLRETYIEKDTTVTLEEGMAILAINGLQVEISGQGVLYIALEDLEGHTHEMNMSLRTTTKGKEE